LRCFVFAILPVMVGHCATACEFIRTGATLPAAIPNNHRPLSRPRHPIPMTMPRTRVTRRCGRRGDLTRHCHIIAIRDCRIIVGLVARTVGRAIICLLYPPEDSLYKLATVRRTSTDGCRSIAIAIGIGSGCARARARAIRWIARQRRAIRVEAFSVFRTTVLRPLTVTVRQRGGGRRGCGGRAGTILWGRSCSARGRC
jgi:hypothetical protein